jgi:hypothetical protein
MARIVKLTLACWNYDRTRALTDGSVRIDGVELTYRSDVNVSDIFRRMLADREFDVSELGLTFYLRTLDLDDPAYIAIPVFPNRFFRHASVFVNRASGIASPRDLIGKRVGEQVTYGHDAGVWAKGILSDDYGVAADSFEYFIGSVDAPSAAHDWLPSPRPAGLRVTDLGPDRLLGPMLEAGEIDALFSARLPACMLARSPRVGRLFEDYEAVERDYFARTAIFPIMHTVVIRRELHDRHPGLAQAIYRGFCEAKDRAVGSYQGASMFQHAPLMIPWFGRLFDEDRELLGDDWWPYGFAANRTAIDTFLRYHYEQGLSKRRLEPEEIFVPELLAT